jgi:poly(3-hydroxybutyrate) depolymerase
MLNLRLKPYALTAALLTVAAAPVPAQELNARDHEDLGKILKEYLDPKASGEDQVEVKEDLLKKLEKIGKKQVEKGEDPVQGALALTADLGQALFQSNTYKKQRGGKVFSEEMEVRGTNVEYSVWVPKPYKHTELMPLLLCVPGMDEGKPMAPGKFLTERWTDAAARDGALIAAVLMPEDTSSWTSLWTEENEPGGVATLMSVLGGLREKFAVDPDRVYLVGRESGVSAVVSLGSKYPHLFAGVVGQAGDVGEVGHQNYRNLPSFIQGGGAQATTFLEAIDVEYKNCTFKPAADETEIWAWMGQNKRLSNPAKVTLRPGAPVPNKAYWIEIPATEGADLTVVAEANRETNTITVTAEGVDGVTIYFNDDLVDLDKPVKIILNGREREEVIPRSVDDLLALIVRGTSDSGKIYVARRTYELQG